MADSNLPDSRYVASFPLQEAFLDKDTGLPLSGGSVGFYKNESPDVLKAVYQQEQQSPFGFTELVNPVTLTSIGTFGDDNGTDIIPFLFPYDSDPNEAAVGGVELYYIKVLSSEGVEQFTRSAWPPNVTDTADFTSFQETENQIANPQFVEVLFAVDPATSQYAYTVASGTTTVQIAQDWYIKVVATGAGTVTLSQDVTNTSAPAGAPYALNVNSSGLITSLKLYQRLVHSPLLLTGGYVNGYVSVASQGTAGEVPIVLTYEPSNALATDYTFPSENTTTTADNAFTAFTGTVLVSATNTDTATTGYVDFVIDIAPLKNVLITNAQMIAVEDLNETAEFIQQSTPRQIDHLFHYYKPQLEDKPIPSYTIGWDFGFNPCQELGTTVAVGSMSLSGTNKSRYIADQTIAFQAVDNSLSFAFSTSAGLTAATANATQWALVQYLGGATAQELLKGKMAVKLKGNTTGAALTGYVNIYWNSNAAAIPTITSTTFQSLVSGMTSGIPAVANGTGTWNKVQRSGLGNAVFSLPLTTSTEFEFNGWSGLDAGLDNSTPINGGTTASAIAIVVSFTSMPTTTGVVLEYISLVAGDIATRPAPLNFAQTLQALEYYYETSYGVGVAIGTATAVGMELRQLEALPVGSTGAGTITSYATAFEIKYKTLKRSAPAAVSFYNAAGTLAQVNSNVIGNGTLGTANSTTSGSWTAANASTKGINYLPNTASTLLSQAGNVTAAQAFINFHYVADARPGVI